MLAASATSLVVVPANPLRAKSGTAAAMIAARRSSLSKRGVTMARDKVSAHSHGCQPAAIALAGTCQRDLPKRLDDAAALLYAPASPRSRAPRPIARIL